MIGTVADVRGGILPGAVATASSPALIGGPAAARANGKGQLRIQALPPGLYVLEVSMPGFATYREEGIAIGAGPRLRGTRS